MEISFKDSIIIDVYSTYYIIHRDMYVDAVPMFMSNKWHSLILIVFCSQ
jgi:hypothetical protein